MRYMGSKAKHAAEIVPIVIKDHNQKDYYVEPFLGGGNLFSEVPAQIKWGNDTNKWAVSLLEALSRGWEPPDILSETEYYQIKEDPYGYDAALVGFAAFSCSYAGKEWGGYARGKNAKGEWRNYAGEQVRNLEKQREGLVGAKFTVGSYLDMDIPHRSTIYCDPPYDNTTGYSKSFNHKEFWSWCDYQSRRGCSVFVSEYSAPEGWKTVWRKTVNNTLVKDTGSKQGVESLWVKT